MDEVGKMILSPAFWVGTIVVGVLVNLLSSFLYPRLGALPGKMGHWRRARSAKRQRTFELTVRAMHVNPRLVAHTIADETRARFEAAEFLIVSVLCYVTLFGVANSNNANAIVQSVMGVGGGITLLLAKLAKRDASDKKAMLEEARLAELEPGSGYGQK